VISLSLPQKLWTYATKLEGDAAVFSGGNMSAFAYRTDDMANLTLRVRDCDEYLAVRAWIMYAMLGNTFDIQMDANDSTTVFNCYLDAPTFQDGFKPRRMSDWPDVFEVDVTIRSTNGVPIYLSSTGLCGNTAVFAQDWIITNVPSDIGGLYRIALTPPFGSGEGFMDPTTLWTPGPPSDLYLARSAVPPIEWITDPLTAGYFIPSHAIMGGVSPTSPAQVWARGGLNITIAQVRDDDIVDLIYSFKSADHGFGFLGGGDYVEFYFTGSDALVIEEGDRIMLMGNSYNRLKPGETDDGARFAFAWGSVPGPLTTTRLYGASNVTEL
jgi:hypothetical protein